jgi:hypothetical protein
MTRHLMAAMVALALVGAPASANLPASAISALTVPLYGMYTTSDPTCQTGLVATIPLSATPTPINFATAPSIGTGPIPSTGINCVVIIVQSSISLEWKAGTYSGTTQFGSSVFNDSNCNAGGSEALGGCFGSTTDRADFPPQVQTDLAALGLTGTTDCATAGSAPILPLYLSTYSKCVGEVTADNAIGGGCEWSLNTNVTPEGYRSNHLHQAPTGPGDTQHGVKIEALAAGVTKYKLVVDPTPAIGGNSANGCGGIGAPRISFEVTP